MDLVNHIVIVSIQVVIIKKSSLMLAVHQGHMSNCYRCYDEERIDVSLIGNVDLHSPKPTLFCHTAMRSETKDIAMSTTFHATP